MTRARLLRISTSGRCSGGCGSSGSRSSCGQVQFLKSQLTTQCTVWKWLEHDSWEYLPAGVAAADVAAAGAVTAAAAATGARAREREGKSEGVCVCVWERERVRERAGEWVRERVSEQATGGGDRTYNNYDCQNIKQVFTYNNYDCQTIKQVFTESP